MYFICMAGKMVLASLPLADVEKSSFGPVEVFQKYLWITNNASALNHNITTEHVKVLLLSVCVFD